MQYNINQHNKIIVFIDKNYDAILDNGLMDDVLVNEYKTGVAKLDSIETMSEGDKKELMGWLDSIVNLMIQCATDNIAFGRTFPVFENFMGCLRN